MNSRHDRDPGPDQERPKDPISSTKWTFLVFTDPLKRGGRDRHGHPLSREPGSGVGSTEGGEEWVRG